MPTVLIEVRRPYPGGQAASDVDLGFKVEV